MLSLPGWTLDDDDDGDDDDDDDGDDGDGTPHYRPEKHDSLIIFFKP